MRHEYTTLIGKNDCGKSSFVKALQLLFDQDIPFDASDVCQFEEYPQEDGCSIEATLGDCDNSFDFVSANKIRLRRVFKNNTSYWEYLGKIPRLPILEQLCKGGLAKKDLEAEELPELIRNRTNSLIAELHPKGHVPRDVWKQIFERLKSENLVEFVDGWCMFEPDNLSKLVQVVMLEADAKGEDEVKDSGRSIFSQIGDLLLNDAIKKDETIQTAIELLKEEIERASTKTDEGKWILDEFNQFEAIFQEEIRHFDKGVTVTSTLSPPRIPDVKFRISVDVGDQWAPSLDKMGHGLRRSVVFAMLNTLRRIKKSFADKEEKKTNSPLFLFLVEEPELYLHPQAEQRRMRELRELSALPDAQVILCTHSALFVDLLELNGILRFQRPDRKSTSIRGWSGKDIEGIDKEILKTAVMIDSSRAAMLFADYVILVEGSEKVALPHLAEKLDIDFPDVEIVDCRGNSSIPSYQKVLEGFGIKYVAWLDSDKKKEVKEVKDVMSKENGRLVLTEIDWEKMNGLSAAGKKPYKTWKHFVDENNAPNDKLVNRIRAAYTWKNYEKD